MPFDKETLDAAALWAVRTQEPAFEDWEGFTAWLEQDPGHGEAYDHVMLAAEDGAAVLLAAPANDEAPALAPAGSAISIGRLVSGLAACLALFAALWVWQGREGLTLHRTDPGETRLIALSDGSTVTLAGGTQIAVDADGGRFARLDRGQALFDIRHDESDPFTVEVGKARLVDAGTIFDVAIRSSAVTVGVSEGAVIFNPSRQNVRIEPGEALRFGAEGEGYETDALPLDQVGEWRSGRLTFRDAALADVAADISRATGIDFVVADGAARRTINGSVVLESLRADPGSLGPLLGISVRQDGQSWVLAAP